MKMRTLQDLLIHEIKNLYSAEKQLLKALPTMAKAVSDDELRDGLEDDVRDAAIIAAAQRVEHYEIAGYGCARTFAEQLGFTEAARLLQETLDEEKAADEKLTHIAMQRINLEAASH